MAQGSYYPKLGVRLENVNQLAEKIGITARSIERNMAKLREKGILERIGNNRNGSWKVKIAHNT